MTWIAALLGLGAGLLLAEVLRRRHRLTGRHRGSPLWRVHCRDIDGTRAEIWVTVGRRHVVLAHPMARRCSSSRCRSDRCGRSCARLQSASSTRSRWAGEPPPAPGNRRPSPSPAHGHRRQRGRVVPARLAQASTAAAAFTSVSSVRRTDPAQRLTALWASPLSERAGPSRETVLHILTWPRGTSPSPCRRSSCDVRGSSRPPVRPPCQRS